MFTYVQWPDVQLPQTCNPPVLVALDWTEAEFNLMNNSKRTLATLFYPEGEHGVKVDVHPSNDLKQGIKECLPVAVCPNSLTMEM